MANCNSLPRNAALLLTLLAATALAAWVWSPMLDLSLLGWDAYPLIAASRVEGFAGFASTFGEELMDGRYPLGHYYRPLVHLSFALDHALWGLAARGYHVTDLALTSASVLAMGWLAYELCGRSCDRVWGALGATGLAAFELATHPSLIDVLPAVARRADLLAVLFTLLALVAQAKSKPWVAAALVVAAMGSKETGAIAAVVVGTLACVRARNLRSLAPLAAAVALFLLARTAVLGGVGGGRESSLALDPAHLGGLLARYLDTVLGARAFGSVAAWMALGLFVAITVLRGRGNAARSERARDLTPLLLAIWFVGLVAITALSGVERGWYELAFVPIRCLVIAWLVSTAASAPRPLSAAQLGLALGLVALDTWPSIPAPALDDLRRASDAERAFLARFENSVRAGAAGTRITVPNLPMELASTSMLLRDNRTIAVLAPYSVEAYAELALPERKIRLEYPHSRSAPPAADELVVVLAP
jgi:hypothetical protein